MRLIEIPDDGVIREYIRCGNSVVGERRINLSHVPIKDPKDLIPQGKWEKTLTLSHDRREVISVYKCSICNALKGEKTSFCPDCGAKMLNN